MKIALLSGSWPPDRCGVGDYTAILAEHLSSLGLDILKVGKDVRFASPKALMSIGRLARSRPDIVHIQYPTMGYNRSFVPALVPPLLSPIPTVVTLHEFSSFKSLRKPWFITFAHYARARIFSSAHELESFRSRMKPRFGTDYILPIPSNIPRSVGVDRKPGTVCYFGLLVPKKGIEDFFALVATARSEGHFSFSLIGGQAPSFADYAEIVKARAISLGIDLHLDLPELEVARVLASQTYAYLPYPDGATARRGSLLAAQANGTVVVTTWSQLTTARERETTFEAVSPDNALTGLKWLENHPETALALREAAQRSSDHMWRDVAVGHQEIYRQVLAHRS